MSDVKKVCTPLTDEVVKRLKAGDMVVLSGVIYTARDKAHKIMTDLLKEGKELPADFRGQIIYKCVKSAQTIAYPELQSEAVRRLEVEDLPCIVAIDCEGGNLFEQGIAQYRQE